MSDNDFIMDLSGMPWPDAHSSLFRAGTPSRSLAWIPQTSRQWTIYAAGYLEAGRQLYASWKRCGDDCLVFPLVFVFRHYVELRLKELILSASSLLDLEPEWQCKHDLKQAWNRLMPILRKAFPEESNQGAENAGRLILEFAARDSISMQFRYPVNNDGKRHLADLERIDVDNFFATMEQLAAFLEGASSAVSAYLSELPRW